MTLVEVVVSAIGGGVWKIWFFMFFHPEIWGKRWWRWSICCGQMLLSRSRDGKVHGGKTTTDRMVPCFPKRCLFRESNFKRFAWFCCFSWESFLNGNSPIIRSKKDLKRIKSKNTMGRWCAFPGCWRSFKAHLFSNFFSQPPGLSDFQFIWKSWKMFFIFMAGNRQLV